MRPTTTGETMSGDGAKDVMVQKPKRRVTHSDSRTSGSPSMRT